MLRLPRFRYLRPSSVEEAVRAIDAEPRAMFVAGGTDLFPNMKRRQVEPPVVIGLGRIEGLRGIEAQGDGGLRIGALTTLREVVRSPAVRLAAPAVTFAAGTISTPLLRNTGTIGGNLLIDTRCNYYDQTYEWRRAIGFCIKKDGETCWVAPGSPRCWAVQSSDLAPVLSALGATVTLVSERRGAREVSVEGLYQDDGVAHLRKRSDELLTAVWIPSPGGWRAAYYKVRRRGSFDFPVLGVAVALRLVEGAVVEGRIRLGGVGSYPVFADAACAGALGEVWTEDHVARVARAAARPARPLDNTDYQMTWRKRIAEAVCRRALRLALAGDPGGVSDRLGGVVSAPESAS